MKKFNLFSSFTSRLRPPAGPPAQRAARAQSFVELALIIPVLILMLLGMMEVVIFIGRYLDILDMTREAARFASLRDYEVLGYLPSADCRPKVTLDDGHGGTIDVEPPFHFYFQTSCIFSPPQGSPNCTGPNDPWCNGVNSYVRFNPATDDIVISVYTIEFRGTGHIVSNTWPQPDAQADNGVERNGYWAYSDNDSDTAHNNNWKYDCQGNLTRTTPHVDYNVVNDALSRGPLARGNKGYVAVEFYYCYDQVLALPVVTEFVPNPVRIHAYTLMPLPSAAPTPTPRP